MLTSLVHIGDVHAAPGPRSADRWHAVDQIIDEGLELQQLGAWLLPGDLFDALSTADDRNAWDARLQRMAGSAPVVLVYGNHDRKGDLDGFANLRATHPIYVIDRPHVLVLRLATAQMAAIFCLPYPQKGNLVAAAVAPADVVNAAADLLEPLFMAAAAQLEECRAAGYLTLMIGHVNVAGAKLSNGQPSIGHEIELNPKHLDRLGDIPKLLNHVHKPQAIAGAHYAGSVCRLDYGEIEQKRYLIVHFDEEETHIESRPIDVAPMFHIDGVLTRNGFTIDSFDEGHDAEIHRRLDANDWSDADVRVRYRYQASEKAVIDETAVRELFAGALRLKVEGVAIPDRELRAPEVALAKTLYGKLAAYLKVDTLEPSLAEKLWLLEHSLGTGGPSVANIVAEQLAAIERPQEATAAA